MVQVQLPQALTLNDILVLVVVALAVYAMAVLGVIARSIAGRGGEATGEKRGEPERKAGQPEESQARLDDVLERAGIDKAMAREFLAELRKAMKTRKIRPALVSEDCQGRVVYDFAKAEWLCVSSSGDTYPLGGAPAGEKLELEEEVA